MTALLMVSVLESRDSYSITEPGSPVGQLQTVLQTWILVDHPIIQGRALKFT